MKIISRTKIKSKAMAKVDTIELSINGKSFSYNINVGKTGLFKCKLDWNVAEAIGIDSSFEFKTLSELKSAILIPYHAYLDAKKTEEVLIWIRYQSSGKFAYNQDGSRMFDGNSKYNASRFSSDVDSVAFEFGVVIKETASTGNVIWYETQKGQGSIQFDQREESDPNTYYKRHQTYKVEGKLIPYSEKAMDTLTKAQDGIRKISEILYGVISQDEKQIEAILMGGKLLSA
ncbi:MAG: hypothetical protein ABJG41_01430 [Cyclobacteriaceae bacterium]